MLKLIAALMTAATLALATALPARADEKDERAAAAKETLKVMHATDGIKNAMPAIGAQIRQSLLAKDPTLEKDLAEILPPILEKANSRSEALTDMMAAFFAARFTVAELAEIKTFFSSPTGAKLAAQQATIAMEMNRMGQGWGRKVAEELSEEAKAELRKRGHAL